MSSDKRKKPTVLISSIDAEVHLPYQWALLKSYSDDERTLADEVTWFDPLHLSLANIGNALQDKRAFARKYGLKNVDVLGLSCYVWNRQEQHEIAKIAKAENPKVLVVAGGPEVAYRDPEFFEKNPQIDILVKKDGEIPFRKILLAVKEGLTSFAHIPGLVIRGSLGTVDTGPSELLPKFHKSPWLHNKKLLEPWITKHCKSVQLTALLETNRGCPYACTFCNWGVNTMSKVRLFDLANIKNEIRWFSKIGIQRLHIADANFGILARDEEIVTDLATLSRLDPKPAIHYYTAKNNPERSSQIAISLHKLGLVETFALGIQTTSQETLTAIGRSNMTLKKHRAVVENLKKNGVIIYAGLILGCPGETLESWKTTIAESHELGVTSVGVMPFQILVNSPADEPAYRKEWQIETMYRLGERSIRGEYIRSTRTFSKSDYIEMYLYAYVTTNVFDVPSVQQALRWLRSNKDIPYRKFFDDLYDGFFKNPVYATSNRDFVHLNRYVQSYVMENDERRVVPVLLLSEQGKTQVYNPKNFLRERSTGSKVFLAEFEKHLKDRYSCSLSDMKA